MKLSNQESAMVKNNLKQIENWVESIMVDIREDISIPLYHEYYKICFYITKKRCFLRVGQADKYLTDKHDDGSNKYFYLNLLSNDPSLSVFFLSKWKQVKEEIERKFELQMKSIELLNNFEV